MKQFALTVLLLSLALYGNAQSDNNQPYFQIERAPKSLTMGLRFGGNLSAMRYSESRFMDNELTFSDHTGILGAFFVDYKLPSPLFSIIAEAIYSQQGANVKLKYKGLTDNGTATVRNTYLNVPLMVGYGNSGSSIQFKAGLQAGFILSSAVEHSFKGTSKTYNTKDMHKSLAFSLPVGVSVNTKLGLVIDGRYNIPLTNLYKGNSGDGERVKNSWVSISFGWRF